MVSKYTYGAHAILLTYDVTNYQVSARTQTDMYLHSLCAEYQSMTIHETQLCP